jgi:hypothetical protein
MAIQITDNTDTIDISFDGNADLRCIHKTNCSIERSGDHVSIFDCGITPPKEYVVKYDEVTNYSFTDGADFFHQINAILNNKYSTANVVDGVELNNQTSTKIIDANPSRRGLVISNSSNHGFYIKFQAATVDNDLKGIFVPPTSNYELTSKFIYTGEISGIAHENSPIAYIQEW